MPVVGGAGSDGQGDKIVRLARVVAAELTEVSLLCATLLNGNKPAVTPMPSKCVCSAPKALPIDTLLLHAFCARSWPDKLSLWIVIALSTLSVAIGSSSMYQYCLACRG